MGCLIALLSTNAFLLQLVIHRSAWSMKTEIWSYTFYLAHLGYFSWTTVLDFLINIKTKDEKQSQNINCGIFGNIFYCRLHRYALLCSIIKEALSIKRIPCFKTYSMCSCLSLYYANNDVCNDLYNLNTKTINQKASNHLLVNLKSRAHRNEIFARKAPFAPLAELACRSLFSLSWSMAPQYQ